MRNLPILFSLALFGSALLSFSVQPILGKMLLPMVGGAPAGWIVALAFFQLSLLAGYGVARLIGEFFREPDAHLGLLLAGATMGQLLSLPMVLVGAWLIWRARRV